MQSYINHLAAFAAVAGLSAPVAAQSAYGYPQQYPQAYPQQPYQGYGNPQGYGQNSVAGIIDQLLGNRYNVSDRTAVSQCASAAMAQAASYGGNGYGYNNGYNGGNGAYGYNNHRGMMRVTAITDVQRRSSGLRVSGLMSSGGGYGGQYGYQNRGYGYGSGDVSFRCNVDYRGQVTNIRIGRNNGYRG